jgi:hypothetical protein
MLRLTIQILMIFSLKKRIKSAYRTKNIMNNKIGFLFFLLISFLKYKLYKMP